MSVHKIKSTPKDRKSLKRQAFLDAARRIFAEKGFQAANVTDIVAEVKSGQGTFYYHFKDKQAIFDELMIGFIDSLLTVLAENDARGGDAPALADRARAIDNARRLAAVYIDHKDLAALFFRESRYIGGEAMDRTERLYALLHAQVENGLRMGQAAGLVHTDLDPRIAAHCFVGAAERAIFEAIRAGDHDIDRIAEQIVDFQSKGILKTAASSQ